MLWNSQVREKVVDVDGAISELVQLMEKTEEQLRKRKVMKNKVGKLGLREG